MAGTRVRIRPLEPGDVPRAVEIISAHDTFDGRCSAEYYQKFLGDAHTGEREQEQNYVALDENGKIAGVCGFAPDKYGTPRVLWLTWFYVDRAARGRGFGRALLGHTLAVARRMNARKVYLDTSSGTKYARAVAVYEKVGFKREGSLTDYYANGEHNVILGLDLAAYSDSNGRRDNP